MSSDSSKVNQPISGQAAQKRPSKFLSIVEAVLITILCLQVVSSLVALLMSATGLLAIPDDTFIQFLYVLLVETAVVALLVWLMRRQKLSLAQVGVQRPRLSVIGWALLGFFVYIGLYMLVYAVVTSILPLDTEQRQQLGFDQTSNTRDLLLIFISLVILPPLAEEFVFRGYLYTRLRRAFRLLPAALIVSLLFSFGHLQLGSGAAPLWVAALDTLILSLVLVWLREKTGNIWAGVLVHACKNGLAFTSLFLLNL